MALDSPNCAPDFPDHQELKRNFVDLMETRGRTAVDRLERELGGVKAIVRKLHSSTRKGVIGIKDGLARREVFGSNHIPVKPPQSFFRSFIYSLTDSVLIILVLGAIAALILGWYHPEICDGIEQTKTAWMEGCGILGTVVVIIFSSALSDFFRDREFYKMQVRMENSRKCTVIRSGKEMTICCKDLKVGDLCVLQVGSIVPADGVLVQSNELLTNDRIVDGGQIKASKGDADPLVFAGSYVREGSGRFLVIAVGKDTQACKNQENKLKASDQEFNPDDERTTLQGKLNKASAVLGLTGIIVGALVTFIIIIRFSFQTYSVDGKSYDVSHWIEFVQAIIMGIVIIIIAEPEALSLAVTITLSYCIEKMHSSRILVRNVDVVEKMGNLTTICCGKTGVLTELSELTVSEQVVECYMADKKFTGHPRFYGDKLPTNVLKSLCDAISINTSYSSNITSSGPECLPKQTGDRTECALLQFVLDLGVYYPFIRKEHPEETFVKVFGFSPERRFMSTVIRDGNEYKIYVKGAPEAILPRCTGIFKEGGKVAMFTLEDRGEIDRVIKNMQESSHLKVMCIAQRPLYPSAGEPQWEREEEIISEMTLIGLVGIDTVDEYVTVESRKRAMEGKLGGKTFRRFQDLKKFKDDNFKHPDFPEEICRGIAVSTKYSSNIEDEDDDNLPKHIGDSNDGALLQLVLEMGETYQIWRDEYPEDMLVHRRASPREAPSSLQHTAVVIHMRDSGSGGYKLYCKGAPGYVLPRCTQMALPTLENIAFDDQDKRNIWHEIDNLQTRKQFEVICLALKYFPENYDWDNDDSMSNLTFLGYIGIDENVRTRVPDAIWDLHQSGIKVCMVTGDNLSAAGRFGSKSGILSPSRDWPLKEFSYFGCDSKVFSSITKEKFDEWWPNELRILASAGAADRLKFVEHIRRSQSSPHGEIVAVTASGVNDDKVLRSADVGLTMGVSGTDVAKESADIVLENDDFTSIVEAVKWGRNLYETILKFLQFQLTVAWVAIIVVIVGACVTKRSPLSATQLLWINLIMDSLASFALTRDQPSDDIFKHKPYGRSKPLISRALLRNVIGHSIYQLAVMFLLMFVFPDFLDMRNGYEESSVCRPTQHKTMVFTTFVFMQLFNEINCRRLQDRNVFSGLLYGKLRDINFVFIIVWIASMGIQIIIVQFFTNAFRVIDMEWDQWMWSLFFGFSELIWAQLVFTIPKEIIPRQIRCCANGITRNREGCCEKLALMRGVSKVRKQNLTMYTYDNNGSARFFDNGRVSPATEEYRMTTIN